MDRLQHALEAAGVEVHLAIRRPWRPPTKAASAARRKAAKATKEKR